MAVLAFGVAGLIFAMPGTAGAAGSTSPATDQVPTSCSASTTLNVTTASTTSSPATTSLTGSCAFAPGSAVSVSGLGSTQSTNANGTSGLLTVTFSATDPTLSFDGGAFQPAVYGVNTITATGTNATGATNTATFLVDIVNVTTASTSTSTPSTAPLAFTGADLAALIAAALALILLGTGVVVYTRRRAASVARS